VEDRSDSAVGMRRAEVNTQPSGTNYVQWVLARYEPGIELGGCVFYTCKKCGSTVVDGDALQVHDTWHLKQGGGLSGIRN